MRGGVINGLGVYFYIVDTPEARKVVNDICHGFTQVLAGEYEPSPKTRVHLR